MSGPAIHHLVGEKIHEELIRQYGASMDDAASGLTEHKVYRNLGTMGPDFLFFNTKDMPEPVRVVADVMQDVTEFIESFRKRILELVPEEVIEAKEAFDQAVEDGVETSVFLSELEDTVSDFQQVTDAILATVSMKIQEHVTDSVDIFELLKHPIQSGEPRDKWWWFDSLHYRRTGTFAETMLKYTSSNPKSAEHAYVLGYLSHIASDVVGHPYVNMIAGGPYRTFPQRHKVVESFNDVWAYNEIKGEEFAYSHLYKDYEFEDGLPDSIAELISNATKEVYGTEYGSSLEPIDVKRSYDLWFKWFKNTTASGTIPIPEPYSLSGELQEAWDQFEENMGDIFNGVGNANEAGGGGFTGLLAALAAAILASLLVAAAIADYLAGVITTLSTSVVRYFLSVAYENLYDAYTKYRLAVSLNGLAFPLREHLNLPIVNHVNDPNLPDTLNHFLDYRNFPHLPFSEYGAESHLVYPWNGVEEVKSKSAPHTYRHNRPTYYMYGDINYNPLVLDMINKLDIDHLDNHHNMMEKEQLGSAVRLTTEFYQRFKQSVDKPIPCFSLDGDRGIGYACWETPNDLEITGNSVNLNFVHK